MDFLGMGSGELILVLVVALLIFGPNKVVDIARQMGKFVASVKKASTNMTTQLTKEVDELNKAAAQATAPITKEMNDLKSANSGVTISLTPDAAPVKVANSSLNAPTTQTQNAPKAELAIAAPDKAQATQTEIKQ